MHNSLPLKFTFLFWEFDLQSLDHEKYWFTIVERLIEKGNTESIAWTVEKFGKKRIIEVINSSKNISPKTRNFWRLYFAIYDETK